MSDLCPRCRSRVFVDADGLSAKCVSCGWRRYFSAADMPPAPKRPTKGRPCIGFGGEPCPAGAVIMTKHKRCPDCSKIHGDTWRMNQNHRNSKKSPWHTFVNYRKGNV